MEVVGTAGKNTVEGESTMSVLVESDVASVEVPGWVHDLATFREWIDSDVLPEKLSVHFLNGDVWVDLSMEEFFSHNQVKAAIHAALYRLISTNDMGSYVPDGMRYTCETTGFSTEPDAMYFSHETYERGDVEFRAGTKGKATELVGTPDLVIEVVSPSTVEKDTDWLMENYFEAGIPEYWLIDARGPTIQFDVHKATDAGFVAVKKPGGWVKSAVLGKAFKLTRTVNRAKLSTYKLDVR